eukprot:scaffold62428_cov58-Attheya_sp.AAC.1
MALITLVPGLWKFFFPETYMCMYSALYPSTDLHIVARLTDFLNAVGHVTHHSGASLIICGLLTGVMTVEPRYILEPTLVCLMQHWFVLLYNVNKPLYYVLELSLEAWFEWLILSTFEIYVEDHWVSGLAGTAMLVLHWFYLVAGGIALCEFSNENARKGLFRDDADKEEQSEQNNLLKGRDDARFRWTKGRTESLSTIAESSA